MYIGHVGPALAGKRARNSIGLIALLLATYAPDGVDAGLCFANAYSEQGMLSHSVPAVLALALIGFAVYAAFTRDVKGGMIIGVVVVSHLVLDWVTGSKPTWPGGPMIGLQLYGYPLADFVAEGTVIVFGLILYAGTLRSRRARRSDLSLMLGSLLALQVVVDVARALATSLPKC